MTALEFASKVGFPLRQIVADLKKLGVRCTNDQVLSSPILEELSVIYERRSVQRNEFKNTSMKMGQQKEDYLIKKLEEHKSKKKVEQEAHDLSRLKKWEAKVEHIKLENEDGAISKKDSDAMTVLEFAGKVGFPLRQVLADLKKLGVKFTKDQFLSNPILEELSVIYERRSV